MPPRPHSTWLQAAVALLGTLPLSFACGSSDDDDPGVDNAAPGDASGEGARSRASAGPTSKGSARHDDPQLCAPVDTFSYALCTCDDLTHAGQILVRSGASGAGSVGVNGRTTLASHADASGSWVSHGSFRAGTGARIGGSLHTGSDLSVAGALAVGADVAVGDKLTGAGYLTVGGDLRVAGSDVFLGARKVSGARLPYEASPPPCGCEGDRLFDVRRAVASAKLDNDNAARGLSSRDLLEVGVARTKLPTGRYFFDDVTTIGRGRFEVTGNVSIYLDGDLTQIGYEDIVIAKGATLDLYVSGSVRLVGYTPLGDPEQPSAFRLYVGGDERLSVSVGRNEFYGSIYAPAAEVVIAGSTVVVGSVLAKQVVAAGQLVVEHGGAIPGCTPPLDRPPATEPAPEPPLPAEPPTIVI